MRLLPINCHKIFRCTFPRSVLPILSGQRQSFHAQALSTNCSMSELLVGVCQMTSSGDVKNNIETCKKLLRRAKERGAKVAFLPEGFDYISENKEMAFSQAHTIDGEIIKEFSQMAKDLNIWLSLGGFHEKSPSVEELRVYNTHLVLANDGSVAGKYNKLHLFDNDIKGAKLMESESFIPGEELPPVVKTPVGNIGLAICYDLRFPEISLSLAQQGADILSYPSAFTFTTGAAHWEILLRARAIETQCYVIAAAQSGQNNAKRKTYGHAMVVDPWGHVIAQCQEGEDVCVAAIDLEYLKKVRRQMPVWKHRRDDVYGKVGQGKRS